MDTDPIFLEHTGRKESCRIASIIFDLPEEQGWKLQVAMDDPRVSGPAIARVLVLWGHKVTSETIRKHRKGDCACSK